MKNSLKGLGLAILGMGALLQTAALVAQSQEETGAKSLFYDPATGTTLKPREKQKHAQHGKVKVKPAQPSQVKYPGIHYWIELKEIGPVTDARTFYTGERIKLHIRSNVDGYLSLWTLDSSGRGHLLFPDQTKDDNFVKADTDYAHPGFIKFSLPVEDERLLVFFSRSKSDMPAPSGEPKLGPGGAKDLVFEREEENTAEVGAYVANKNGGPVAQEIRLKHRPR